MKSVKICTVITRYKKLSNFKADLPCTKFAYDHRMRWVVLALRATLIHHSTLAVATTCRRVLKKSFRMLQHFSCYHLDDRVHVVADRMRRS